MLNAQLQQARLERDMSEHLEELAEQEVREYGSTEVRDAVDCCTQTEYGSTEVRDAVDCCTQTDEIRPSERGTQTDASEILVPETQPSQLNEYHRNHYL